MSLNTASGHSKTPYIITGLTATGTTQGTALPLANNAEHEFTSVPAGSGCIMPPVELPSTVSIFNADTNALAIYPAMGGSLSDGAMNTPVSLAAGSGITFWASGGGNWYPTVTATGGGGGSGTPGGANGQLQYNNAGAFGGFAVTGDGVLTAATGVLTVNKTGGVAFAPSATIDTTNAANITTGTFPAAALPMPSASTLGGVESYLPVSHQFLTSISTSGVPASAQPAFTDISGTATAAQLPNPSASTLGGVESYAAVTHQFLNTISTSGVPASAQPAFTDISGTATTAQLGAAQVTYAKIQNASASTLLGNPTGSPAAPAEITLGTNLSFAGSVLNASGGAGNPGGTSNQIQYDNAGAFGGFTMSGDATLAVSTGVITVGHIGGQAISLAGALTHAGAFATTITSTAATSVTLPTSGTLVNSAVAALNSLANVGTITAGTWQATPIATAYIAGNAVTYAKMQVETASTLLGNPTGSGAAPAEITLGSGLSFSGSTLVATAAVPGGSANQIQYDNAGAFGGFTMSGDATLVPATGAITVSKIGGNAVTLAGALSTSGAFPVTLTSTASTNVTLPVSGTLVTTTVAALNSLANVGTITSGTWQATPIATAYLAANAVTYAKLQSETAHTLLGNPTGSGAVPAEITLGTNLSFSGSVLNATGSGGSPGGSAGQVQLNSGSSTFTALTSTVWTSATLGAGSASVVQGSTTYGSDQTSALQTLLTAAAGGIIYVDGQYGILGTLAVPSNTTVIFPKGCGLISLIGRTAGPLMTNSGFQAAGTINAATRGVGGANSNTPGLSTPATLSAVGSFRNTNIRIVGGIFNCNGQNLTAGTKSDTLYSLWTAIQMWGVDGLTIEDPVVYDSPNYGIWCANVRNVRINNPAFRQDNQVIYGSDNIHINGPAQYISITNAVTHCYDDNIAFNADDGFTAASPNYPWAGPITDVHVNGWQVIPIVSGSNGGRGIRLLSNSQRIDRVIVEGVRGTFGAYAGVLTPFYYFGSPPQQQSQTFGYGNYGSVTFRDWQFNQLLLATTGGDADLKGAFSIDGGGGTWVFENIRVNSPTAAQPLFWIDSRYSNCGHQSYTFTNCEYYEGATTGNAAPLVALNGRARYMKFNNCRTSRSSRLAKADSPILKIASGNSTLAADTVILEGCHTDNVSSMVEVAATTTRIGLLKVGGYHHNSGASNGVTIGSGATIDNFDSTGLVSDVSPNYSNSGTITVNITTGGTYAIRSGIPNLQDRLLAYYRMAETSGTTVVDALGANNLTAAVGITNGATFGGLLTAKFTGSQWYVSGDTGTGNPRLLNLANQIAPYTVAGWANLQTPATQQCLFSRGSGIGATNWGYILTNTSAEFFAEAGATGTNVTSGTTITTATWHHLALVADPYSEIGSSPLVYLYLDGSLVGSTAFLVPTAPNQSLPLVFGSLQNSSSFPILNNGLMQGWGVWAAPLTAYQVGLAYNSGTPVYVI